MDNVNDTFYQMRSFCLFVCLFLHLSDMILYSRATHGVETYILR